MINCHKRTIQITGLSVNLFCTRISYINTVKFLSNRVLQSLLLLILFLRILLRNTKIGLNWENKSNIKYRLRHLHLSYDVMSYHIEIILRG